MPADVPTYQYCAAEVNHKLPDVDHEILAELYILEDVNVFENGKEDDNRSLLKRGETEDYWETLEMEAKKLVGYKIELEKHSKWRPKGYLHYQDSEKGIIPLVGVPVHLRKNIFVGHQCCTDKDGYFSFTMIREKASYLIRWKRDDFKVKNDNTGAADVMLKKNTREQINHTFYNGETQWRHASVFRAALYYYYGDIYSLKRPPNGIGMEDVNAQIMPWNPVSNGTFDEKGTALNATEITINSQGLTSRQIFNTTICQLAKAVHCRIIGKQNYQKVEKELRNTWSDCCGAFLTDCYYQGRNIGNSRILKMENALNKTWYYQNWLDIVNK